MARTKTTSKKTTSKKTTSRKTSPRTTKAAPARAPQARAVAAAAAAPAPPEREDSYSLAASAKRLGAPDPALEAAVRAVHPDNELQQEGAKVSSERILADGQRLVSRALTHLESDDPAVQNAVRQVGLTRGTVALTADALGRLSSTLGQLGLDRGQRSQRQHLATHSIEAATNDARVLKRHTLDRLKVVQRADPAIAEVVLSSSARAETPEQLAMQLTSLAQLITGLTTHTNPVVRTLAAARALGASDADALTHAVEAIGQATPTTSSGTALREEKQAVLDVLDGLCLVLIDDLLRALRAMARVTTKVRKPVLHDLAGYFGARGKADDEPEAPPAPTPA